MNFSTSAIVRSKIPPVANNKQLLAEHDKHNRRAIVPIHIALIKRTRFSFVYFYKSNWQKKISINFQFEK